MSSQKRLIVCDGSWHLKDGQASEQCLVNAVNTNVNTGRAGILKSKNTFQASALQGDIQEVLDHHQPVVAAQTAISLLFTSILAAAAAAAAAAATAVAAATARHSAAMHTLHERYKATVWRQLTVPNVFR